MEHDAVRVPHLSDKMPDAAFHGQAVDRAAGRAAQTLLILATSTSLMSVLQRGDRLGAQRTLGCSPRSSATWMISESTHEGLARAKSSGSSREPPTEAEIQLH